MPFGSVLGNIVQGSRAGEAFEVGVMTKNNITSTDRKTVVIVFYCQRVEEKKKDVTQWFPFVHNVFTLPGHHYNEMVV